MNPDVKAYFQDKKERQIGDFLVAWDGCSDFLRFEPTIVLNGELINRLLVRNTTSFHFGPYAIDLLFNKLMPSINNKSFEFIDISNGKYAPAVSIGSTTSSTPWINKDRNGKVMRKAIFRDHEIRIGHDDKGAFLDWPHLSQFKENQFRKKHSNHPSIFSD